MLKLYIQLTRRRIAPNAAAIRTVYFNYINRKSLSLNNKNLIAALYIAEAAFGENCT